MSRSLKIRKDCIDKVKLAFKHNGFRNQRALAEDSGLALSTVSNFLTGKPVDYATFVEICKKLLLDWQTIADIGHQTPFERVIPHRVNGNPRQDWGEAIDISIFYGRQKELTTLNQVILEEGCKVICLLGMGGMGKTAMAVKLARQIQSEFEFTIWRTAKRIPAGSLRNAPPPEALLTDLIGFLSE